MSLGTILIIIVIIYLIGGWSGRIGGYGYGYGHSGMGLGAVVWLYCWSCFWSASYSSPKSLKINSFSNGCGMGGGFIIHSDRIRNSCGDAYIRGCPQGK